MGWRAYDEGRDFEACARVWREVGWLDDDEDRHEQGARIFFGTGRTLVAPDDGPAECMVQCSPGSWRHVDVDLPLTVVGAVTTSHIGRRRGWASELVAEQLACARDDGSAVAALGMFEQGFYDRFGFGSGPYEHFLAFDPAHLRVPYPSRHPVRLGADDWQEIDALHRRRQRGHGGVVIHDAEVMRTELLWRDGPWGMGLRDPGDGRLTAAVCGGTESMEHGPYVVEQFLFETDADLLDLLGLVRSLEDQVHVVQLAEPAGIVLQDVLDQPIADLRRTSLRGGRLVPHRAWAEQQQRIIDLPACIAAHRWDGSPVEFVAEVTDPLADRGGRWAGIGGTWTITIGSASSAVPTDTPGLPRVSLSVNALTQLWTGSRRATQLATIGRLHAEAGLVADLDRAFALPAPLPGIAF